jgi:predicted RNase H-like HicB family nuclease
MEEARRMAQEAIALYLEDMTASDEKVPEESGTLWSTVEVEVPAR